MQVLQPYGINLDSSGIVDDPKIDLFPSDKKQLVVNIVALYSTLHEKELQAYTVMKDPVTGLTAELNQKYVKPNGDSCLYC